MHKAFRSIGLMFKDGLDAFQERTAAGLARDKLAKAEERRRQQRLEAEEESERKRQEVLDRMRRAQQLAAAIDAAQSELPALLQECAEAEALAERLEERVSQLSVDAKAARLRREVLADDVASAGATAVRSAIVAFQKEVESLIAADEAWRVEHAAADGEAAAAAMRGQALAARVTRTYWAATDEAAEHLAGTERPTESAQIARLVARGAQLPGRFGARSLALARTLEAARGEGAALSALSERIGHLKPKKPARPTPPGRREYSLPTLSKDEEEVVKAALADGPRDESLADYKNIPITRSDMATLGRRKWLNDEVINYFFKLLEERELRGSEAAQAGRTDEPAAAWPRCHFMQTNFYTKLSEGGSYTYKNVARWTRKVDVFAKELIIVPVHVHGNHWTLAVINFKEKRLEYYDSLRGPPENVLVDLRRWLEEESQNKKKVRQARRPAACAPCPCSPAHRGASLMRRGARSLQVPFDASAAAGWTDVVWKEGETPSQENGFDCGIFMTRTADWIARDARLAFTQEHMERMRRIHVLEIMRQELMPP